MKIKYALVATFAMTVTGSLAMAQPPQGGPGGHGGPGGPPPNPIMEALDPDKNHELSKKEINNATRVLRALDKNGDGILNEEDLGQMGPPNGGRGPGGPGGPGGPHGGGGEGPDRGAQTEDFASRLAAFDKNDNGSIEKDELPERMQRVMARLDTNKDDVIDADELKKMKESASQGGGNAREQRGQRGGRRGGGGEAGGRRGRGGPEGAGGPQGGRGSRGGQEGGMHGGRGGADPARFVEHAMTFDADGDGLLSKDELTRFAAEMGPPRGQGGPQGGPGMGGPSRGQRGGGQRGGGGGNQQRRRPN